MTTDVPDTIKGALRSERAWGDETARAVAARRAYQATLPADECSWTAEESARFADLLEDEGGAFLQRCAAARTVIEWAQFGADLTYWPSDIRDGRTGEIKRAVLAARQAALAAYRSAPGSGESAQLEA